MTFSITTARLRLRPIRRGDARPLQALCNNWNVARMLARVPYPSPVEVVEAWTGVQAAAWESGLAYNFAIEHQDGEHQDGEHQDRLIGVVGVARCDDGGYEIGYWLGEPWWGQGLMTEAVGRILDFARASLGLDRLRSDYFVDNPASGRVQEKCGFRITGRGHLNSQSRGCQVETVFTELELSGLELSGRELLGAGPGTDPDGAAS